MTPSSSSIYSFTFSLHGSLQRIICLHLTLNLPPLLLSHQTQMNLSQPPEVFSLVIPFFFCLAASSPASFYQCTHCPSSLCGQTNPSYFIFKTSYCSCSSDVCILSPILSFSLPEEIFVSAIFSSASCLLASATVSKPLSACRVVRSDPIPEDAVGYIFQWQVWTHVLSATICYQISQDLC